MPLWLDTLNYKLVLTTLLIYIHATAHQDCDAVFWLEPQPHVRLPAHALNLSVGIFQRKVTVAAWSQFGAGDLTGNPDIRELPLERVTNRVAEFPQTVDAPFGQKA